MTSPLSRSTFSQTRQDFKESWKLLKANYRAFLGTQLFAFLMTIITATVLILIMWIMNPNFYQDFSENPSNSRQFLWIIISVGYLIITTFTNCQTGLAYDIMSSGDMFAEFKSSFTYFRLNWWKYILISCLLGGMDVSISFRPPQGHPASSLTGIFAFPPMSIILGVLILSVLCIIGFIWFVLWVHSLASVNAQHPFFDSLKESFRIFKANKKRVLSTWGLYFLIFAIPGLFLQFIATIIIVEVQSFAVIMSIILVVWNLFVIFIGLPMRALLVTGLYNNTIFDRIPSREDPKEIESK
jgi:hypothetical protein